MLSRYLLWEESFPTFWEKGSNFALSLAMNAFSTVAIHKMFLVVRVVETKLQSFTKPMASMYVLSCPAVLIHATRALFAWKYSQSAIAELTATWIISRRIRLWKISYCCWERFNQNDINPVGVAYFWTSSKSALYCSASYLAPSVILAFASNCWKTNFCILSLSPKREKFSNQVMEVLLQRRIYGNNEPLLRKGRLCDKVNQVNILVISFIYLYARHSVVSFKAAW